MRSVSTAAAPATLWKWENGAGAIANRPCDSKGERSCMNYMHVRIK